jgi:DNA-binding transcriptional ArsR family regulator
VCRYSGTIFSAPCRSLSFIESIAILSTDCYDSTVRRGDQAYVARTKKQLAALASSARQEIVDVLSQMGTVSVSELAASLGRPADALYYHLRVLRRAGLVMHADDRNQGRRHEELFRTVSPDLQLRYEMGRGGNSREITAIVGSMLRLGTRDFRRTFQSGDAKVSGSGRELWALRRTGWLTLEGIVRVNQSIESLVHAVSKPRGQGRLYAITVLLTPLDHRARGSGTKVVPRKERPE